MQYARLGETGLVVSRLGFGAMTFGETEMVPGVRNEVAQALAVSKRTVEGDWTFARMWLAREMGTAG